MEQLASSIRELVLQQTQLNANFEQMRNDVQVATGLAAESRDAIAAVRTELTATAGELATRIAALEAFAGITLSAEGPVLAERQFASSPEPETGLPPSIRERNARFKAANIKFDNPPVFKGNASEDSAAFLYQIERFGLDVGLLKDDLVILARQQLRGTAADWLRDYDSKVAQGEQDRLHTWEQFTTVFLLNFPEPQTQWVSAIDLLGGKIQQGNRRVREYIAEIRRAFMRAGKDLNDKTKTLIFWRGLTRGLREKLDLVKPDTLEAAYAAAEHFDERFQVSKYLDTQTRPDRNAHRHNFPNRPPPANVNANRSAQQSANANRQAQSNDSPVPMELGNLYCTRCRRRGHDLSTCWSEHPELRPARQQNRHGNGGQRRNQRAGQNRNGNWPGRQGARVNNVEMQEEHTNSPDQEN